jgi:hypothetical protein
VRLFIELPVIVQTLKNSLDHTLVNWMRCRSPAIVMDTKLLPKVDELGGAAVCEILR